MNLIASPSIIFFPSSETVCNLDLTGSDLDGRIMSFHVFLSSLHGEELDEGKTARFTLKQNW